MDAFKSGNGLIASLWGAAGVFLLGFFGAEALFAPGADGLSLQATLVPSILAAVVAFAYLMTHPLGGEEVTGEREAEPRQFPRAVSDPPSRPPAPAAGPHQHAA